MVAGTGLRLLVWHVHGTWTSSFVQGRHTYLLPVAPDGGPSGRGRAGRPWPGSAVEVPLHQLHEEHVDAVVLQRPKELELTRELLGRRPGVDVPAIYVEHNTPRGGVPDTRHVLADQQEIPVVHVTHFNDLMWDNGSAPTTVIPHGIADPGALYTGAKAAAAVLINEPVRRWRTTGTDLLAAFARVAPLDVYGMKLDGLTERLGADPAQIRPCGDLPTAELHRSMAQRRVYLHTARWTSLGLSLIEAMMLGMPVVVVGTTETPYAVPADAGVVSTDVTELTVAVRDLLREPERAREMGQAARRSAKDHHGLAQFLDRWDALLSKAVA